jgi:UDP-N-acetylglucosamine--N-acetylmuramyl-(pentapeptide) pyrophosphoryl-undecaprenol N-acetylglucosamine transferase
MKVLFSGGGTMGSVSPLVGIYEELKDKDSELEVLWLGTKKGPEKDFLKNYNMPYKPIIHGKLRQYFSLANLFAPFCVFFGFIQSLFILKKFNPQIVLTAGSFVAVPVAYAAKVLNIPVFIHQQDLQKGLANKIMQKLATKITITLEESKKDYPANKTVLTSNPVRKAVFSGSNEKAVASFKLDPNLKTILIFGGGQGAQLINQMVQESLLELTEKIQIIHIAGKGKTISGRINEFFNQEEINKITPRYREFEFLNKEIFNAYAIADLVVSRAGFSALTELAVLAKPVLLIPIPGHQEKNAQYFAKTNAVRILNQQNLTKEMFVKIINAMMENPGDLQNLSQNISQMIDREAAKKYVELIKEVVKK